MTNENFDTWLEVLETTELPQAEDFLYGPLYDDEGERQAKNGYCCLGIACKIAPEGDEYLTPREHQLLPARVADWLGLGSYWDARKYNQDWESVLRENRDVNILVDFPFGDKISGVRPAYVTAAGLNDAGCTFAQIAQMIKYFGVREVII